MDSNSDLVFDIGSYQSRIGISGDDAPQAMFRTVIGRPKCDSAMVGLGDREFVTGDEAAATAGVMRLTSPVQNRIVTNYEDYEKVLAYSYELLKLNPDSHRVLFSVPMQSPCSHEQHLAEIAFEKFNVPGAAAVLTPILDYMATSRLNAVVVDIGEGGTQIVPFSESRIIEEAAIKTDLGGAAITEYLSRMMMENTAGLANTTSSLKLDFDRLKRTCCYFAENYQTETTDFAQSASKHIDYNFVDGKSVTLSFERIRAPEVLFQPKLIGSEWPGLAHLIAQSILKSPMDIRRDLIPNVFISGGTSLTPGLRQRLETDLRALLPASNHLRVLPMSGNGAMATWIGGSIISSLSSFSWMSKAEYDEQGASSFSRYGALCRKYKH